MNRRLECKRFTSIAVLVPPFAFQVVRAFTVWRTRRSFPSVYLRPAPHSLTRTRFSSGKMAGNIPCDVFPTSCMRCFSSRLPTHLTVSRPTPHLPTNKQTKPRNRIKRENPKEQLTAPSQPRHYPTKPHSPPSPHSSRSSAHFHPSIRPMHLY
jgi:hypothetical protein